MGRGKEPNHTTAREPGPLYYIKYSLLLTMLPDSKERNARGNVPKVFVVVEGVSNHELVRDLETDVFRDVTRAQGSSFPIEKNGCHFFLITLKTSSSMGEILI